MFTVLCSIKDNIRWKMILINVVKKYINNVDRWKIPQFPLSQYPPPLLQRFALIKKKKCYRRYGRVKQYYYL